MLLSSDELALISAVLHGTVRWEEVSHVPSSAFSPPVQPVWEALAQGDGALDRGTVPAPILDQIEATLPASQPELLAESLFIRAIKHEVARIYDEEKSLAEIDPVLWTRRLGERIAQIGMPRALRPGGLLARGAQAVIEDIFWRLENPDKVRGIRTNFGTSGSRLGRFDRVMDGLQPGELTLICGQTGGGKTMTLMALALGVAMTPNDVTGQPQHALFFSLEMSEKALARRWLAALSGQAVDLTVMTDENTGKLRQAAGRLAQLEQERRLAVVPPQDAATLDQIITIMRRQQPLDAVFIDYAQIIRTSDMTDGRYAELAKISAAIKLEAERLQVPVVLAAQLVRPDRGQVTRPTLADIAESYALVRNADNVFHVWFPGDTMEDPGLWKEIAVLLGDKVRNRGRPESLYYHADRGLLRFVEVPVHIRQALESDEEQAKLGKRRLGTR